MVMLCRIGVDGLVHAAVKPKICLTIAFETCKRNEDGSLERSLEDTGSYFFTTVADRFRF